MTGNLPPKEITLTIALGDVALLDSALRTRGCIDRMESNAAAEARVDAIRQQLAGKIPPEAKYFDPGQWAVFVAVIAAGATFDVSYERPSWRRHGDAYLKVEIAGASWLSSSFDHPLNSGRDEALKECLNSYAPIK